MSGILNIEITNKCNLNCAWCGRKHMKRKSENVDIRLIYKIAKILMNMRCRGVFIQLYGEPLVNPYWYEIIKILNTHKLHVGFYTNGLLINDDVINKLLDCYISEIFITMNQSSFKKTEKILGCKRSFKVTPIYLNVPKKFKCKISKKEYIAWCKNNNINPRYLDYEPPFFRRKVKSCCFLEDGDCYLRKNSLVDVLTDGRLVGCVRDYDAEDCLGTIDDLDKVKYKNKRCPYI